MPGYPDRDERRRHPGARAAFFRFFCSRRGAAIARALITVWCVAGGLIGSLLVWIGNETYSEFKATRAAVHRIDSYVAGAAEITKSMRDDIGEIKDAAKELTGRVNAIDVRLARQEGDRRR